MATASEPAKTRTSWSIVLEPRTNRCANLSTMSPIRSISEQKFYVLSIIAVADLVEMKGGELDTGDVEVARVVERDVSRSCLL
jgi:hypothetical protein